MRALIASGALLLSSCNDYPNELMVTFDTDAPVASATSTDVTPLFDTLRIDIEQPGQTPWASRTFAVSKETFESGQVSIGLLLGPTGGGLLRARLYLARLSPDGEPNADSSIDVVTALPAAADNPGQATVMLLTDASGTPSDSAAPSSLGPPWASSVVGTWPGAARIGCDERGMPRPPGTACVSGGAYWMGTMDGQSVGTRSATWHRLAVLSPYYLDTTEVTVAAFRAGGGVADVNQSSGSSAFCTFTQAPGSYDSLPVACVTIQAARTYCQSSGGDLPTAAQYELVASNFGRSPYPWGFDLPVCSDAVFDSCRYAGCGPVASFSPCFMTWPSPLPNGGPITTPTTFRDVVVSGGTSIFDLTGNVEEITQDRPFSEGDACFAPHVITDPSCPMNHAAQVRGGSYMSNAGYVLRADYSDDTQQSGVSELPVGFRCAYPATPIGP